MIVIRSPKKSELKEMYDLRWKINRKPFGLPRGTEIDNKEQDSYPLIAFDIDKNKIVGSLRLTRNRKAGEISFMGVKKSHQHNGIGKKLVAEAHKKAKSLGIKTIRLSARKAAEGFYKKLGYISQREDFVEEPYCQIEVEMETVLK